MRAIILILAMASVPAQAADQFDLVCTGNQRMLPSQRSQKVAVRYRIDVDRKIYCRENCASVFAIAKVDDARITFQTPQTDRPADLVIHFVDRVNGKWKYFLSGDSDTEGFCEPAPFSGFPAVRF